MPTGLDQAFVRNGVDVVGQSERDDIGLQAVDDMNGFAYIMSNFQHAGDWELTKDASGKITGGLHSKVIDILDPLVRANYRNRYGAAVGYLSGLPTKLPG